jgi:hypothetical protein
MYVLIYIKGYFGFNVDFILLLNLNLQSKIFIFPKFLIIPSFLFLNLLVTFKSENYGGYRNGFAGIDL